MYGWQEKFPNSAMMICQEHKIIFVAIPKTATRSIYRFLKQNYDGKIAGDHSLKIPPQCRDYFKFAVVRDPYDRICSAYWHSCWRPDRDRYKFERRMQERGLPNTLESFLEIVHNPKTRGRHAILQSKYLVNDINTLLRFENLAEEFNRLPFLKEPVELDIVNSTRGKAFRSRKIRPETNDELLTPRAIELINEIYEDDFKNLGYKMRNP